LVAKLLSDVAAGLTVCFVGHMHRLARLQVVSEWTQLLDYPVSALLTVVQAKTPADLRFDESESTALQEAEKETTDPKAAAPADGAAVTAVARKERGSMAPKAAADVGIAQRVKALAAAFANVVVGPAGAPILAGDESALANRYRLLLHRDWAHPPSLTAEPSEPAGFLFDAGIGSGIGLAFSQIDTGCGSPLPLCSRARWACIEPAMI
jgi:hypothetical protein